MNLHCDKIGCNHNSGFEYSCMDGISVDLIREAHSCYLMCEHLRKNILELEKLFCKDMVDRIVERLEEQSEESVTVCYVWEDISYLRERDAYQKAIEIVKEEGGMNG